MTGHEIGKIFGVPSEFVLVIQKYFGLPFSYSFGHPNILWCASSPFWPAIWHLAPCYFAPCIYEHFWYTFKPFIEKNYSLISLKLCQRNIIIIIYFHKITTLFPVVPLLRIKRVVTLRLCTRTLRRPAFNSHRSLLFMMSETQNPEMQRPKTPVMVGGTSSRQEHALAATVASKWFLMWLLLLSLWRFKLSIIFTHSVHHTGCVVAL